MLRSFLRRLAIPIQAKNHWLDTVSIPAGNPSQTLPEEVDVAVVGAGFTGLAAARTLALRGVTVAVLEAETFGWGASCRNAGMVLTGMKLPVPTLISRYGRKLVHRMYAASLASIDCVEKIVTDEKIDCNFSRCGHLEVASKQSHFDDYEEQAALIQREFNRQLKIIPKSDLRSEIGSDIYFGGMVDEMSVSVNPARYVAGLAQAVQRAGAQMFDHTRVEKIDQQSTNGTRSFSLRTPKGSVLAKEVILASGAYTTSASPALRKKVISIGSYILVTEILPEALAQELSPRNRMIYDSMHFTHYYRLTPDRRLLFGGRAAFFPETANTVNQSAEILYRDMLQIYPQLRDIKAECVWGGSLDFTLDVMPHAGQLDGMHYAVGYAGHGVAASTYFGTKIAGAICGDSNDLPFIGIPFRSAPVGLRSGHTWALPLAGAYYRFLDWIS